MDLYYPISVYFSITLFGLDCTNSRDYNFRCRLNQIGREGLPGHAFFVCMNRLVEEYGATALRL